jgi:hypothetical protein
MTELFKSYILYCAYTINKVAIKASYFHIKQDIKSNKTLHHKTEIVQPLIG